MHHHFLCWILICALSKPSARASTPGDAPTLKASPEGIPKATPEGTPEASDGTAGDSSITPDGSKASEDGCAPRKVADASKIVQPLNVSRAVHQVQLLAVRTFV